MVPWGAEKRGGRINSGGFYLANYLANCLAVADDCVAVADDRCGSVGRCPKSSTLLS